jgi:hypothetical protein
MGKKWGKNGEFFPAKALVFNQNAGNKNSAAKWVIFP